MMAVLKQLVRNGTSDHDGVYLKARVVVDHVEIDIEPTPPVADDFIYDVKYHHPLLTNSVVEAQLSTDFDAQKEAQNTIRQLFVALEEGDAGCFTDLFLPYGEPHPKQAVVKRLLTLLAGVWRDKLAFTRNHRTFNFQPAILKAAKDFFQ